MPQYNTDKGTAVFGVFPTRQDAELGLDLLRLSGFASGEISAVMPEAEGIGGVVAWLAGTCAVSVPRSGSLLAAGPIVAALTRYGLSGALNGLADAERFEVRMHEGAVLVAVHCSNCDREALAAEVLKRSAAEHIAAPTKRQSAAAA